MTGSRFAGPNADTASLPVALSPCRRSAKKTISAGSNGNSCSRGTAFGELSGPRRTNFANDLAASIRRRALVVNGFRTL
jgi:hypothetical protein